MGDELEPPVAAGRAPDATDSPPGSHLPEEDPFLGRVINGRVRIIRAIARGGMGKVYYGEQVTLSRPCAVKVLDKRLAGGDKSEFNKRFLLEASTSAKLTHPNVVKIFDYGETEDGVVWLAMEYLEGKTLSQEIEANGRLEPGRAIHVALQVARALREAHAIGVVHRDMKPGNVFLLQSQDEGDLVKVLDFGLVKVAAAAADGDDGANLTQVGQIMGSPKYMAPEQSQGHEVDGRADIYSLGATLFAMITAHAPFERPNAMATMMAHLAEPVPRLEAVSPGVQVPPGLEDIILRCMAKNRDHRYASMDELLLSLRSYRGPGIPMNSGAISGSGAQLALSASGPSASISAPGGMPAIVLPPESAKRLPFLVLGLTVLIGVVGVMVIDKVFRARDPAKTVYSSAPVPSAPPSTAASAKPPVPTATLEVVTEPPGARVKEDGLELCATTPCSITYKGDAADAKFEHLLEILKSDYRLEKKLVKTGAGTVTVKLTRAK